MGSYQQGQKGFEPVSSPSKNPRNRAQPKPSSPEI